MTRQKPSRPRLFWRVIEAPVFWVNVSHGVDSRNASKAVLPKSTATTAVSPGLASVASRLARGLRITQCTVATAPDRELRDQRGVDLERVGPGVEPVPEEGSAEDHQGEVERAPQPDRGQVDVVGVDQLHPDEGEQSDRGRPHPEPLGVGEDALVGVAARDPGEPGVDRAERADRLPDPAEQQRGDDHADPDPDVEDAEDRVDEEVLAADRDQDQVEQAERCRRPGAATCQAVESSEPASQAGAGRPLVAASYRGVRQASGEDHEGDRDRGRGAEDRQGAGDRQVLRAAEAVLGEQQRQERGHRATRTNRTLSSVCDSTVT